MSGKVQIKSQARQILSLEVALEARSCEVERASTLGTLMDLRAPREGADEERMIGEQARRIVESEEGARSYEVGRGARINDVEKKVNVEVERRTRKTKMEGMTRKREGSTSAASSYGWNRRMIPGLPLEN